MPTYTYKCDKCENILDKPFVKVDARHNQICKKCGTKLILQFVPVSFRVKGYSAKNSYGVHATIGEVMDKRDRELGKEPMGRELNELVSQRKTRKKMPRLVEG